MYGRRAEAVEALGALVLDVDAAVGVGVGDVEGAERWKRALRSALGADVRAVVWPSRSWGVKAGVRHKALVPLARPLPVAHALPWVEAVGVELALLGVELDPACLYLARNQDLPGLPNLPSAPSVEVWPSEPAGDVEAWAELGGWPGRPLDPDAPLYLPTVREVLEAEPQPQPPAPPARPPAKRSPRLDAEPQDAARAERRARARLEAWGRATLDGVVDKIRAGHWGGRNTSAYRGGLWLLRLARTDVGSLGPALDASEVEAVLDAEVYALGLPSAEARDVLRSIRHKAARRGGLGLDALPDDLRSIMQDLWAEGGR